MAEGAGTRAERNARETGRGPRGRSDCCGKTSLTRVGVRWPSSLARSANAVLVLFICFVKLRDATRLLTERERERVRDYFRICLCAKFESSSILHFLSLSPSLAGASSSSFTCPSARSSRCLPSRSPNRWR